MRSRDPAILPGEEQLEALAAELFAMWPSGARGDGTPVRAQRALLDLLKAGRIWPDGSPPDPMPPPGYGRSFSELRAVAEAWINLWATGEGRPWNLGVSFLGRGRDGAGGLCFLQDPPEPRSRDSPRRKGGGEPAEWNPGSDAATLERLNREVFGT